MMLSQEKIVPQTLVWKVGMDDWDTAQNVLFKRKEKDDKEKDSKESKKEEVVNFRVLKEIAMTEEYDPNSTVLPHTVAKGAIVKILETKEERVKIEHRKQIGWIKAEDDDGPLIERVKAGEKRKRKRKKK